MAMAATLVGMVHLRPLPGSPRWRPPLARVVEQAVSEARLLAACGFDAVLVENFGDAPFHAERVAPATIAAMTLAVRAVRSAVTVPVGVNVLRNDAAAALGVATVTGADLIRVNVHTGAAATDQGIVEGRAAATLRARHNLRSKVRIYADVHVKHSAPLGQPDIGESAAEAAYRGLADGLIVSGTATGVPAALADIRRVRQAVPDRSLWVGSGITPESIAGLLAEADGAIVGTCLKRSGRTDGPLDRRRIERLLAAAGR